VVVAGILFATGCGGSDNSTTTGANGAQGAALSKQQFIAQADGICTQGNQAINAAAQKAFGGGKPSSQQIQQFAQATLVPQTQEDLTAIKALPAPSGDEDQINAIVNAAQEGLDKIKSDPSLLTQGKDAGGAFTQANKLATAYGLKVCGGG